jgi:SanA protein
MSMSSIEKLNKIIWWLLITVLAFAVSAVIIMFGAYWHIGKYHDYVKSSTNLTELKQPITMVVLGSGVTPEGEPRPILRERLRTAVSVHTSIEVSQIIVSGYTDGDKYNEPDSMRRFLVANGVSEDVIQTDFNGTNTYATCHELSNTFKVEDLLIITQPSHLDRAIFLCRSKGIQAYGYAAPISQSRSSQIMQSFREALGNVKAISDVYIPTLTFRL